jgi:MCM AAA-lid domain
VLKPLIDRFDLIFPFRRTRDEKIIKEYADKKFELDDKRIPSYSAYLQKHIEYCKRFNPKLSEEAKFMLKEYYISIAKSYGSPRVRETIITIAEMIARLKLKNVVDVEDSKETMEFYNVILKQLEQVVNVTTSPADATFEECVGVLKDASFAVSFEELIKSACRKNERVNYYVGGMYKLSENKKLRPICDKLQSHSHIITVGERPIGFRWVKDSNNNNSNGTTIYDSSTKNDANIGDLNDLYDPTTLHKNQNKSINNEKSESEVRSHRSQRSSITDKNHLDNSSINSRVQDSNKTTNRNNNVNDEWRQIVQDFFYDDPYSSYQPLPPHSLEQSPCNPVIIVKGEGMYFCKLHPDVESTHLQTIEHHCKYKDPELHKAEILRLLKEKEEE